MLKLVIVDDESIIREGLRYMIRDQYAHPAELFTAGSGAEALELVRAENPSVMLIDINMPEMDGFSLISQVREIRPDMRFIIITGYDEYSYALRALRLRVEDFLTKPIDPAELFALLEKIDRENRRAAARLQRRILRDLHGHLVYLESMSVLETDLSELETFFGDSWLTMALTETGNNYSIHDDSALLALLPADVRVYPFYAENCIIHLICTQQALPAASMTQEMLHRQVDSQVRMLFAPSAPAGEAILSLQLTYRTLWRDMLAANLMPRELYLSGLERQRQHEKRCKRPPTPPTEFGHLSRILRSGRQVIAAELHRMQRALPDSAEEIQRIYLDVCASIAIVARPWALGVQSPLSERLLRAAKKSGEITGEGFAASCMELIQSELKLTAPSRAAAYSPNVQKAIDFIRANLRSVRSVDEIARKIFLHPNYISSIFRKEVGTSLVKYINNLRIEEARHLLSDQPELSVEEIAERTGFQTTRYFYKAFKDKMDMSPGEYRRLVMDHGKGK